MGKNLLRYFYMRRLAVLLVLSVVLVLLSCNNKMGHHKDAFSGHKQDIKYKQKESFGKKPRKVKGSYSYNKSKRRVTNKDDFLVFSPAGKRGRDNGSYGEIRQNKKSTNRFDSKKRRVTNRNTGGIFRMGKGDNGMSFGKEHLRNKGSYIFNAKKRMVVGKKRFFFFNIIHKRERENSSYRGRGRETKGSYAFNPKKKRVLKKKFLFVFNRNVQEKETSTFSGGKTRRYISFHIFGKGKKGKIHKKSLFRKKSDNTNKRRKTLERDLFNPKMGVKI